MFEHSSVTAVIMVGALGAGACVGQIEAGRSGGVDDGGPGGGNSGRPDGPGYVDEGEDGAPGHDAGASCVTAPSYPEVGSFAAENQMGGVVTVEGGGRYWSWMGVLDPDAQIALLGIDLYPGYGAFAQDAVPRAGTFEISGAESLLESCGVCVTLYGDLTFDAEGNLQSAEEVFLADAGRVILDRVDTEPGGTTDGGTAARRIAGSFAGLTLHEIDPQTGAPIAGGCRTAAVSGSFDTELIPPP